MAKGLNKVMLIGVVWPKDPEMSYTPSGVAVCKFTLSTDESYKGEDGNWVSKTQYHNIVAWRKLGEICSQFLKKGSTIHCEGKIQTDSYEKDGKKNYITKIVINEMLMLDKKESNSVMSDTPNGHAETVSDKSSSEASGSDEDLPF
ncbi:MAG: single-stranded DNA-binding protein [Ignavibacteria bacterium]|nr:single-stranded DNA-binding protein [Ignavibacteria bacterium]